MKEALILRLVIIGLVLWGFTEVMNLMIVEATNSISAYVESSLNGEVTDMNHFLQLQESLPGESNWSDWND